MALQVDVPAIGGITVVDAYVRVSDATISKDAAGWRLSFGVAVFKDATEAAKDAPQRIPAPDCDRYQCAYNLNSNDNAVAQAYTHLKTLATFTGAVDV